MPIAPTHRRYDPSICEVAAASGRSCGGTSVTVVGNATGQGYMVFVANNGAATCAVTIDGLARHASVRLHRFDSLHGNPLGLWTRLGSPAFPTPSQIRQLKAESELQPTLLRVDGQGSLQLSLEANALAVVVV